jgi:hypothetical protein
MQGVANWTVMAVRRRPTMTKPHLRKSSKSALVDPPSNHRSLRPALWAVLIAAGASAISAHAEEARSLIFYSGFRDSGSFTDVATGAPINIRSSASFAVGFDFPLDEARQLQMLLSYQDSQLAIGPAPVGPSPLVASKLPIRVLYFHVGGPVYLGTEIGHGAYVVGGLGATLLTPSLHGYSSELRPSANLGVGYEQPLGNRLALRIEARGYFTLVNSSGGLFCSGGCTISVRGDTVAQGELSLGLAYRL